MKKTTLRILTAVLAMLFILTAFSACGGKVAKEPDKAILDALDATEKLSAKSEAAKTLAEYSDFNSIEYNINLGDLIGSVFSAAMGGMNISLSSKLDLNMKMLTGEDSSYASLALLLNDTDFVRLDAHASSLALALASETLLGNTAYGASFEKLFAWIEEQFGAELEAAEVSFKDMMTEALEMSRKGAEISKKLGDILNKYKKIAVEALFENADTVRTEETVTVNGVTADAVVFTATIDENDALKVIEAIYTNYKNDTETRTTIEELAKLYGMTDDDIAALYKDIEDFIAEPVSSEEPAKLRFVIDKKQGNLISSSILDIDGEEVLALTLGLDPENPTYFALEIEDTLSLIYRVTENTEEEYAAELAITVEGETVRIPLTYNKTTGRYSFAFSAEGTDLTVDGTLKAQEDMLSFSMDEISVKAEGQTVALKIGLTMTLKKSGEAVPAMPEYTDLTQMTEKDFAELGAELEAKLGELMMMLPTDLQFLLGSLMGG